MSEICGISFLSIVHLDMSGSLHNLINRELIRAGGIDLCIDRPGTTIQLRKAESGEIHVIKKNYIDDVTVSVYSCKDSLTEENYNQIMEIVSVS